MAKPRCHCLRAMQASAACAARLSHRELPATNSVLGNTTGICDVRGKLGAALYVTAGLWRKVKDALVT